MIKELRVIVKVKPLSKEGFFWSHLREWVTTPLGLQNYPLYDVYFGINI